MLGKGREAAMKMTVITDKAGNIVGAAHHDVQGQPGAGAGGPVAGPEQALHVIEVPEELENFEDAGELHNQLRTFLDS
jgi:hypothetical protein